MIHEDFKRFFGALPKDAHPMAACSAAVGALSTFYPDSLDPRDPRQVEIAVHRLLAKMIDARGLRLQALDRPALHVSAQRSLVRRQLPAHDVRQPVRAVRGRSRRREGRRPAADPARGPRAELLDEHGPPGRLLQGEPLRGDLGGHQGALGPEPRRGQPGGDRDARADRRRGHLGARSTSSARRTDTAPRG